MKDFNLSDKEIDDIINLALSKNDPNRAIDKLVDWAHKAIELDTLEWCWLNLYYSNKCSYEEYEKMHNKIEKARTEI